MPFWRQEYTTGIILQGETIAASSYIRDCSFMWWGQHHPHCSIGDYTSVTKHQKHKNKSLLCAVQWVRAGQPGKAPAPWLGGSQHLPSKLSPGCRHAFKVIFNTVQLLTVGFGTHTPLRLSRAAWFRADCWVGLSCDFLVLEWQLLDHRPCAKDAESHLQSSWLRRAWTWSILRAAENNYFLTGLMEAGP